MAGKKLKVSVTVRDEDGKATVYQAGDTPTAEDAKLITNPDVWEDDDEDEGETPGPGQFTVTDEDEVAERAKPAPTGKSEDKPKATSPLGRSSATAQAK